MGKRRPAKRPPKAPSAPAIARIGEGPIFPLWPPDLPVLRLYDGPTIRLDDGLDLIDLSALLNDGPTSNPPKARQVRRRRPLVPLSYPT